MLVPPSPVYDWTGLLQALVVLQNNVFVFQTCLSLINTCTCVYMYCVCTFLTTKNNKIDTEHKLIQEVGLVGCPELSYRPVWWPTRCPIFANIRQCIHHFRYIVNVINVVYHMSYVYMMMTHIKSMPVYISNSQHSMLNIYYWC